MNAPTLPFTGERFTPECQGEIWHEHWHRYLFVQSLAKGRAILDAACGEGYGSAYLAKAGASVTGVDLDPAAIAHASARYRDVERLRFVVGSVTQLPLDDASVDLVVSFETIEHLAEQSAVITEFRRVLKPDGWLVLSSPNRPVYSGVMGNRNEFHVKELDRAELATLLGDAFPQVRWYSQRLVFQSMIWSDASGRGEAENLQYSDHAGEPAVSALPAAYYITVCGGATASPPQLTSISLLSEASQGIYQDYMGTYRRWRQAEARIEVLEQQIAAGADAVAKQAATTGASAAPVGGWADWLKFPFSWFGRLLQSTRVR